MDKYNPNSNINATELKNRSLHPLHQGHQNQSKLYQSTSDKRKGRYHLRENEPENTHEKERILSDKNENSLMEEMKSLKIENKNLDRDIEIIKNPQY